MNTINFVGNFLYDNYIYVILALVLLIGIGTKITDFTLLSKNVRVNIAKKQISQIILSLVNEAEQEYKHMHKSGAIKRSTVIKEIYEKFPVLAYVVNQDELVKWIDDNIKESLKKVEKILEDNIGEDESESDSE